MRPKQERESLFHEVVPLEELSVVEELKADDPKSLTDLYDVVGEDVERARRALDAEDSEYHRRVFVRAVFAAIEATTYLLKQNSLQRIHDPGFSAAELALLREESYSLSNRGKAEIQPKFLPLDQNFRFALCMCVRGCTTSPTIDFGGVGWESFKQAIQIRNRITHPKSKELMSISDAELQVVEAGYAWFDNAAEASLQALVDHLKSCLAALKEARARKAEQSLAAESR